MSTRGLLPTLALLLLAACAPPPIPDQGADSGSGSTDGGAQEGGAQDGGATSDGGTQDGGAQDGGAQDGGAQDGGSEDGGAEAGPPTVTILFPETREDVVVCPTFVMVVDIDNLELTDFATAEGAVEGQGHWHLYDSERYVGAYVDSWGLVTLDNDGSEERHILTVALADNVHSPLLVEATVEIKVGPEDCIGGDPGVSGATDGGSTDAGDDTGGR